jgi:DNA-binding GntR family transcriptional regulator
MGRPVKLLTIQELEEIFRADPGLALEISAKAMSVRGPVDEDALRARHNEYTRKSNRKKRLEKHLLKQAV